MLQGTNLRLRDFTESDIPVRIRWETEENEYLLWDAPWETEGLTPEEKHADLDTYISRMQTWPAYFRSLDKDALRSTFQIETLDDCPEYIGWVNSYCLDEDFCWTEEATGRRAVGIDLPTLSARGKGYGSEALCLFLRYLIRHGKTDLYTQTWSGNVRMIHLAEKLGFEECCRKAGIRTVRGQTYDGLTFRLNHDRFARFCQTIL